MNHAVGTNEDAEREAEADAGDEGQGGASPWQQERRGRSLVAAVLSAVAACGLSGRDAARAGGACRTWRRALAAPSLWRAWLQRCSGLAHRQLRALSAAAHDEEATHWRWQYVCAAAPWRLEQRSAAPARLLHAALRPGRGQGEEEGELLALAGDDASVTVWQLAGGARWALWARGSLAAAGWARVERVQWAPRGYALLATGPLALSARRQLAVLRLRSGELRVASRAGCGPGAAGCWAGHAAYLALRPLAPAPRRALTAVWLHAADQETDSEYTGVMSLLFEIYNEESTPITHALVAAAPAPPPAAPGEQPGAREGVQPRRPGACPGDYFSAILQKQSDSNSMRHEYVLVAACGAPAGGGEEERGVATALAAWPLRGGAGGALSPPPLLARRAASLAERRAALLAERQAAAAPGPAPAPEPPDEATLRARCRTPSALCRLRARVLGLQLHPNETCVWAATAAAGDGAGAACVSLPGLAVLRRLAPPPRAAPHPWPTLPPHYVQPAASSHFVGSPEGGGSGRVWLWTTVGGACAAGSGAPGEGGSTDEGAGWGAPLPHGEPALAVALPAAGSGSTLRAIVVTTGAVYVWRCLASEQPRGE